MDTAQLPDCDGWDVCCLADPKKMLWMGKVFRLLCNLCTILAKLPMEALPDVIYIERIEACFLKGLG